MKIIIVAFWIIIHTFAANLFAQSYKCNFDYDLKRYFDSTNNLNSFINYQEQVFNNSVLNLSYRDEITIPLVFHVFNKQNHSNKVNIADIYKQIDYLNDAFSGQNSDLKNVPECFKSTIGSSNIKFCIAYRLKDGQNQKGIIFHTTTEDFLGDKYIDGDNKRKKIKHSEYGGANAWDSNKYINIWIGEMAYANGTATFPGINQEYKNEEGIILNSNIFNNSKNLKTIVHEMGHYFNLFHIWGNEGGCFDDDRVDDTPMQETYYSGCPQGEKYSCGSLDMYKNYMDYTNDHCSLFFTKGQIERMLNTINTFRNTLIDSRYLCDNKQNTSISKLIDVYSKNNMISILKKYPNDSDIKYILFDTIGRKLKSGIFKKGQYIVNIDSSGYSSGIYFIFIKSEQDQTTKKLLLINDKIN